MAPLRVPLSGTDDALARTLEVHGPCWVSGFSATDCANPSTEPAPITQFFFNGTSSGGNAAGRLARVRQLVGATPSNCASASTLDTDYEGYDARGNPAAIRDANGTLTTLSWQDSRPQSMTVGTSGTYSLTWEGKHLTAVELPEHNFEVSCYREGTSGAACTGGTVSERLQWQAKAATASGTPYSEKKTFTYWPDGTVKRVSYLDSSGTTRRVEQYAVDVHRRPSWSALGDVAGAPVSVSPRAFDGADNLEAIGHAYNSPPAWCRDSSGAISSLCQKLVHDAADRLLSVADPGSDQATLFSYDAHGNVAGIKTGCLPTDSFSGCSAPSSTYVHDDFGNLVQTKTPWSQGSWGEQGTTQYLRDARGLVTAKRLPSMLYSPSDRLEYSYDTLGRLVSLGHRYLTYVDGAEQEAAETLYALGWDNAGSTPPAGCPQPVKTKARLRKKTDSFGDTWFQYGERGELLKEIRLRRGASSCSGSPNDEPHTTYTYSANGNLLTLTPPFGREVTYSIGTYASPHGAIPTDRVRSVSVKKHNGTSFVTDAAWTDLVTDVAWEPYGGLRGYRINHPTTGTSSAVEYRLGDSENVPTGVGCAAPATNDLSGQLRALNVSQVSGAWTPGSGSGDLLKRTVSWSNELPVQVDSCLLGASTAQREQYAYDSALRLTSASRPSGNRAATGGSYSARAWTFDRRGNIVTKLEDSVSWVNAYSVGAAFPDLLQYSTPDAGVDDAGASLTDIGYQYTHDSAGRVGSRMEKGGMLSLTPGIGYGWPANTGALDSVYKSVSLVQGGTYSYFYDANNRRRLKVYPTGVEDEFFYTAGSSHLLVDVGNDSVATPTFHPLDEYIWLSGRPIVVIRGRVGLTYARAADGTTSCGRNGGSERCDAYFPVTDEQGRVVLMLDGSRRVAGVGEFDVHGSVNRTAVVADTAHPYGGGLDATLVSMQQPRPSLALSMRAHVAWLDTDDAMDAGVDGLELREGTTVLAGPYSGRNVGPFWSGWVAPTGDTVNVNFKSDAESCCWGMCVPHGSMFACNRRGATIDRWEYRKHESASSWFWVPLRLAGQYEDEETGLHENWNRYYEPSGRYLSPEPLLQSPAYVRLMAQSGMSVPTYAYAANNPLRYVDPTGLWTQVIVTMQQSFGINLGNHMAVRVDNGGDGQAVLFDPGGSYNPPDADGPRGSSDAFEGPDSLLPPYVRFHRRAGDQVMILNFDTSPDEEAAIAKNFGYGTDEGAYGVQGGFCASTTSNNLKGIGPFRDLKPSYSPAAVSNQLFPIAKSWTLYPYK